MGRREFEALEKRITECRLCPRLVAHRETVARVKRRAFRGEAYWGRPVPAFGDPGARIVVLGLAPAAHGANRTGRMFTGDRSGDWLYRALHDAGLAKIPTSVARGDGQALVGCVVTAVARCAPPDNRPTPEEIARCRPWLEAEMDLFVQAKVILALGAIAFEGALRILAARGAKIPRPRPRFAHRAIVVTEGHPAIVASYHPSQQNTLTGRLTRRMLDDAVRTARRLAVRPKRG